MQYQDAYLVDNDSRFVFSFVRSAIEAGAAVANYVELVSAERVGDRWVCRLRDTDSGEEVTTSARVVVNAVGPFVDELNTLVGPAGRATASSTPRASTSSSRGSRRPATTGSSRSSTTPSGCSTSSRWATARSSAPPTPASTPRSPTSPTRTATFLLGQINARLDLPRPLTADDVIAERSGVRPLVVRAEGGDQQDADWTSLSRKHEIERDTARAVVTVFGGKLTDCLNVGEEVADHVEALGIPLEKDLRNWYGEPAKATRKEFYRQARLMRLDALRTRPEVEPLSDRLWRRYGRRAFDLLEMVRADPTMGQDVMGSTDYLRAELYTAAEHEMVVTLDDFMRRRSKIDLVVQRPRHPRLTRAARGRRDPLRCGCRAPPRRRTSRPRAARRSTTPEPGATDPDSDPTAHRAGTEPAARG